MMGLPTASVLLAKNGPTQGGSERKRGCKGELATKNVHDGSHPLLKGVELRAECCRPQRLIRDRELRAVTRPSGITARRGCLSLQVGEGTCATGVVDGVLVDARGGGEGVRAE